jgi:DNA repair photolyase
MTRNPQMLLEDEYARIIRNPKLYIDVSITSLHENDPNSIFYSATTPPLNETYASIKKLSEIGKYIRIKIEPIVPTTDEIKGQTKEELDEIVRLSKEAGAKKIISKTMRLNKDMPNFMQDKLMGYYLKNGVEEGYGDIMNHTLSYEIKRRLLTPVYEACAKYDIPFCACVDADVFAGKTVSCSFEEEK